MTAAISTLIHQPAPAAPDDGLVGDTIGRFEVRRLLGAGGAGAVYLAEHAVIHSRVAIKVLTGLAATYPDVFARFEREARATNTIVSPHVPRYYDFGQLPDGRPYAVMEYFEGETLAAYIARRRALTLSEATEILRQIADGMCAAHKAGVIHRDLKPENIFLVSKPSGGSHVVILDFGIAKLVGPSDSESGATHAGLFIGTPHYCAPEQISSCGVTEATDVYALGVIAFELLAGRRPFDGDGLEPLGAKLATDAMSLAECDASLPPSVVVDVANMLARNAGDRMGTMRAARACFEGWAKLTPAGSPTVMAAPVTASLRLHVHQPFRWGRTVVLSLVVALFGGAIGFAARGGMSGGVRSRQASTMPDATECPAPAPPSCPASVPSPPLAVVAPLPAPTPVRAKRSRPPTKALVAADRPHAVDDQDANVIIADPFE